MGVGPPMQEPSDPGGKLIAFVFVDLLRFLCAWFSYVLICMCTYLLQAVSLPPLLGIGWDLFRWIPLAEDV